MVNETAQIKKRNEGIELEVAVFQTVMVDFLEEYVIHYALNLFIYGSKHIHRRRTTKGGELRSARYSYIALLSVCCDITLGNSMMSTAGSEP